MIYLMNSAILPHRCYGMYEYVPAKVDLLRKIVRGEKIGHSQMIELIEQWTGVRVSLDRSEPVLQDGDSLLVMRPKPRAEEDSPRSMGWSLLM
jgi:hypothetical protein